jgi:hypothetical protein
VTEFPALPVRQFGQPGETPPSWAHPGLPRRQIGFLLRHLHVACLQLSDGGRQAVILQSNAGHAQSSIGIYRRGVSLSSRRCPVRQRSYVCWLTPSRRQTSRTFMPFPRSTSACRSRPTICSALCRFFIGEPFQNPRGGGGFSHKNWLRIWGGGQLHEGRRAPMADRSLLRRVTTRVTTTGRLRRARIGTRGHLCRQPTIPSKQSPRNQKPSRSPGKAGLREGLRRRGSGRSRTDDGGFAIRCLSHLATEP